MKRVLLALLLSSSIVFARSDAEEKAERVKTMQDLEAAMAVMQQGFLYNNESILKKGVNDFKSKLRHIDSFIIEVDEDEKTGDFNPRSYASIESRAISKLADEIIDNFKTGTKHESVKFYNKTLDRCLACHRIIRKW